MPYKKRKRGDKWDDELLAEIDRLLTEGHSYYRVGKMLGVGDRHVAIRFPGRGKKPKGVPEGYQQFYIDPETKAKCQELFDEGHCINLVHRRTGVPTDTLYARFGQYAYTPSQMGRYRNLIRQYGKEIAE